ncbi:MAG: hypothetical protein J6A04_04200 [Clostridia bacterium]|nr:hypothetical protein [Clostridia bacterium]
MLDIHGTGLEYIWKEVEKISNISSEDTKETLTYNLPNMTNDEHNTIIGRKFNWKPLYGELGERRIPIYFIDRRFIFNNN